MKKNILHFLCVGLALSLSLSAHADAKPVLLVLTSHGELGDTGKQTGFFLSELTHPLEVFEKAGFAVEMASIKGGEPPVDGLDLKDAVNAQYWNDPAFRAKLSATKKLSSLDPKGFSAVFFAGGMERCGIFLMTQRFKRRFGKSMKQACRLALSVTGRSPW